MVNLDGKSTEECNRIIRDELKEAGVSIIDFPKSHYRVVPASIKGVLSLKGKQEFIFVRTNYWWIVRGKVPLEVAQNLYYDNPIGRKDIRINGNCGCPPPDESQEYVKFYHIDSKKGLKFFVQTIKECGLAD